jgi:hypothetical protein
MHLTRMLARQRRVKGVTLTRLPDLRPLSLPCDKRARIGPIVLAMALACSDAQAEEWQSLSKSYDDHPTETFIDMSSIVLKDNIRTARTKAVLLSPRNDNERRIAFALQPMSFDCKASLVQVGSAEIHYTDTDGLGFIDTHKSWKSAEDPLTKKMFDFVCAWKPTS